MDAQVMFELVKGVICHAC